MTLEEIAVLLRLLRQHGVSRMQVGDIHVEMGPTHTTQQPTTVTRHMATEPAPPLADALVSALTAEDEPMTPDEAREVAQYEAWVRGAPMPTGDA